MLFLISLDPLGEAAITAGMDSEAVFIAGCLRDYLGLTERMRADTSVSTDAGIIPFAHEPSLSADVVPFAVLVRVVISKPVLCILTVRLGLFPVSVIPSFTGNPFPNTLSLCVGSAEIAVLTAVSCEVGIKCGILFCAGYGCKVTSDPFAICLRFIPREHFTEDLIDMTVKDNGILEDILACVIDNGIVRANGRDVLLLPFAHERDLLGRYVVVPKSVGYVLVSKIVLKSICVLASVRLALGEAFIGEGFTRNPFPIALAVSVGGTYPAVSLSAARKHIIAELVFICSCDRSKMTAHTLADDLCLIPRAFRGNDLVVITVSLAEAHRIGKNVVYNDVIGLCRNAYRQKTAQYNCKN